MKKYSFIKPDPNLQNNLMAFGYECGKGWHPLIEELFDKIQILLNTSFSEYKDDFEVLQVKEKYGTLRVYVTGGNDEILDLINMYEKKSEQICETCGKKGTLQVSHGWWVTMCKKCFEQYDKRYEVNTSSSIVQPSVYSFEYHDKLKGKTE